jgi:hypothetical protein
MEERQRICGTRFALNRDEDAAAIRKGVENSSVVRLKSDAAHGSRKPQPRQIPVLPLERLDQRAPSDDGADAREIELLAASSEYTFDQASGLGAGLGEYRQRVRWKSSLSQRVEPSLRPRDVLEHRDGESSFVDFDHVE